MSIELHNSDSAYLFFDTPYNAKRMLRDSVARTQKGINDFNEYQILNGCGEILLARIESIAAFAFVSLSASFLMLGGGIITPLFLIPTTALNLASRLPGISSFESIKNFTESSSSAIYRTFRVHLIALPTLFLFLSASAINTCIPGMLKTKNVFFRLIHQCVEPLGPLLTIKAIVPERGEAKGTPHELSMLEGVEEYLRTLSYKNELREEVVDSYRLIYTYSFRR